MEEINIYKARPIGDSKHKSIKIIIDKELPEFLTDDFKDTAAYLKEADQQYEIEANKLFRALYFTLPGGVFDRLLLKFLEVKKSHFKVSYGNDDFKEDDNLIMCETCCVVYEKNNANCPNCGTINVQ